MILPEFCDQDSTQDHYACRKPHATEIVVIARKTKELTFKLIKSRSAQLQLTTKETTLTFFDMPSSTSPTTTMNRSSTSMCMCIDRLNTMKRQEQSSVYRIQDCLTTQSSAQNPSRSVSEPISPHVDTWCRSKMVEWCYSIVDFVQFSRETAILAMQILDRYMYVSVKSDDRNGRSSVVTDQKRYQLASMTALYLAIKMNEPKNIDIDMMVELGKGRNTPSDFHKMESAMLFDLKWRLNGPTPTAYLEQLIPILRLESDMNEPADSIEYWYVVRNHARYQIELSISDYHLIANHTPSEIAVAALNNSLKSFNHLFSKSQLLRITKQVESHTSISVHTPFIQAIARRMNSLLERPFTIHRINTFEKAHMEEKKICDNIASKSTSTADTKSSSSLSSQSQSPASRPAPSKRRRSISPKTITAISA